MTTKSTPPHVRDGAMYLGFSTEPVTVHTTVNQHPNVLIDVDADGGVMGIEVLDPPGLPYIERPPYAVGDPCDSVDHEMGVPLLRDELAATRRIVAQWLYSANSGHGSDPGDLQNAFMLSGRGLNVELDKLEEEDQAREADMQREEFERDSGE